jgi:hypothetical protein
MTWIRLTSLAIATALPLLMASPGDRPIANSAAGDQSVVTLPPVLRSSEPPDTRQVNLPGPPPVTPRLKLLVPIAPVVKMAPIPNRLVSDPLLRQPVPLPALTSLGKPGVVKPAVALPSPGTPALAAVSEMEKEIAVLCQKQIGHWKQPDARTALGEPSRHRPAYDEKQKVNGTIYAFADPSGRYRELELDFDRETGTLRSVFVYPLRLSWQQCRKLWDGPVSAADATQGRKFYSYSNRRLDVLVDPSGKVISLGWY